MVNSLDSLIKVLTDGITTAVIMVSDWISVFFEEDWIFGLKPGWIILAVIILTGLVAGIVRRLLNNG